MLYTHFLVNSSLLVIPLWRACLHSVLQCVNSGVLRCAPIFLQPLSSPTHVNSIVTQPPPPPSPPRSSADCTLGWVVKHGSLLCHRRQVDGLADHGLTCQFHLVFFQLRSCGYKGLMMTVPPLIESLYANEGFKCSSSSLTVCKQRRYATDLLNQRDYECLHSSLSFLSSVLLRLLRVYSLVCLHQSTASLIHWSRAGKSQCLICILGVKN